MGPSHRFLRHVASRAPRSIGAARPWWHAVLPMTQPAPLLATLSRLVVAVGPAASRVHKTRCAAPPHLLTETTPSRPCPAPAPQPGGTDTTAGWRPARATGPAPSQPAFSFRAPWRGWCWACRRAPDHFPRRDPPTGPVLPAGCCYSSRPRQICTPPPVLQCRSAAPDWRRCRCASTWRRVAPVRLVVQEHRCACRAPPVGPTRQRDAVPRPLWHSLFDALAATHGERAAQHGGSSSAPGTWRRR